MRAHETRRKSLVVLALAALSECRIDRKSIIDQFNPHRNASSTTPMQVGNGNFAYGADITGMQTFLPFNTLSSWGWHNRSLPVTPNQTSIEDFTGQDRWTHGRLVNYNQPNPAESDISNWLIQNPQRINLGRIGLQFNGRNVTEQDLTDKAQTLDLYSGVITSSFSLDNATVKVKTAVHPSQDTVGFSIESDLIKAGKLALFFDYPYSNGFVKFEEPYVGIWNATSNHTTELKASKNRAIIQHVLDATSYSTIITWENSASISRQSNATHRYTLQPGQDRTFSFSATFTPSAASALSSFSSLQSASTAWWKNYWTTGAFLSVIKTPNPNATELQRRIILSQYLLAVNGAGNDPPQESGLTNNGWYGKFHLEMVMWHLSHWCLWSKWSLYDRSIGFYRRFLQSSIERAEAQGYEGARWGKMSDPSGRSAPGEINSLLIWQQPHPMYFAEMEYQAFPTHKTLEKWDEVLVATADFMASYAWWNESTAVYDLGPPMYPVSENTNPNETVNPTFELAYWRFGLDVAAKWQKRLGKEVPQAWTEVAEKLAPLPVENGTYVTYEGIEDMWTTPDYIYDHPGLIGIYGLIPPPTIPSFSVATLNATLEKIYGVWRLNESFGWDFPMLAMAAARLGDGERAADMLLDPIFKFDDVGMPVGGKRVATPYFPASGGLLMTVAMMASGWLGPAIGDSVEARWPKGWIVEAEGFTRAL